MPIKYSLHYKIKGQGLEKLFSKSAVNEHCRFRKTGIFSEGIEILYPFPLLTFKKIARHFSSKISLLGNYKEFRRIQHLWSDGKPGTSLEK